MKQLGRAEFLNFNDQLRSLVELGLPLESGLKQAAKTNSAKVGTALETVGDELDSGKSLPDVIREHKSLFPETYADLVEAGGRSGKLDEVLQAVSSFVEHISEAQRRMFAASLYPMIVICMAYALFALCLVDLAERMAIFLADGQQEPGRSLKFVLFLAETLPYWGWIFPTVVVIWLLWLIVARGTSPLSSRGFTGPWAILPGANRVARNYRFASFAELLALLTENHVPLPESMTLAAKTMQDQPLQQIATNLAAQVESGGTISNATSTKLPAFLSWLVARGESYGNISESFHEAADVYRSKGDRGAYWFSRLFPVLGGGTICVLFVLFYSLTLMLPYKSLLEQLASPIL